MDFLATHDGRCTKDDGFWAKGDAAKASEKMELVNTHAIALLITQHDGAGKYS